MKVMLPVKEAGSSKKELAEGFHNIQYVCIYDSSMKACEWLEAKNLSSTPGGLNGALIQRGVNTIISLNVTPMVLNMFRRNSIEVLKARSTNIDENIRLFNKNELELYTANESRTYQACNKSSCSSCSSSCS
ncbi:NifB/NifX family molybdenum-iron cluster-binding protein [Maribellus sediminis]|uniref:NifB/NifX family molybdenum-iron cluster-binding protein n=1 Tax=Maribellus sediminis TaxID=2696285 RepID=UPI0014317336|nr:NifB/NifX family molybdenum-iron cluster-binding protein [Maribellus sediminis]